ncbi:DUF3883 domain-containing protein [Sinomonas sp.]|uniref:DUF3883 domain-containing protein n=1 Tax=Sinomonas sp. TaxID=1914986 RepID=UPI003F7DB692
MITIRLIDRQSADSDDPLGRDWWGFDPDATPEQLWANNRGDWSLDAKRIAAERWAALSYQGRVVLVAELDGPDHEILPDNSAGKSKKALIGRPLPTAHPIHQALAGTPVRPARGITYDPDPETYDPDSEGTEAAAGDGPTQEWDAPSATGQGLQMDPEARRAIEDAAQERLMRHYRERGWTVTDTRQGHPYDAIAVRGDERVYLEAKGTQSRGDSVIVTRNEVDHARRHPGLCVMGVWSGMRFKDGELDPEAGHFRTLAFNPDDHDLRPRDFDWTLPDAAE